MDKVKAGHLLRKAEWVVGIIAAIFFAISFTEWHGANTIALVLIAIIVIMQLVANHWIGDGGVAAKEQDRKDMQSFISKQRKAEHHKNTK